MLEGKVSRIDVDPMEALEDCWTRVIGTALAAAGVADRPVRRPQTAIAITPAPRRNMSLSRRYLRGWFDCRGNSSPGFGSPSQRRQHVGGINRHFSRVPTEWLEAEAPYFGAICFLE